MVNAQILDGNKTMQQMGAVIVVMIGLWLLLLLVPMSLVDIARSKFEPIGQRLIGMLLALATATPIAVLALFVTEKVFGQALDSPSPNV